MCVVIRSEQVHSHDIPEEEQSKWGQILDFYGHTEVAVMNFARSRLLCLVHADLSRTSITGASNAVEQKDEIIELVKSGPPSNRIDLVFMVL